MGKFNRYLNFNQIESAPIHFFDLERSPGRGVGVHVRPAARDEDGDLPDGDPLPRRRVQLLVPLRDPLLDALDDRILVTGWRVGRDGHHDVPEAFSVAVQ